ncbi:MAG TPA: hypothetical protein VI643_01505 [Planctomycetota bacterium]|nr:hypothetical protein [Planctomycetota bacterium]
MAKKTTCVRTSRPIVDGIEGRVVEGRYQLGDRLAVSSVSDHWAAFDLENQQWVRLVMLRSSNRDLVIGFVRNSHGLRSVKHPGIAAVRTASLASGSLPLPYTALDLVVGSRPQAKVSRTRDAIRLFIPLFECLATIHAAGIALPDLCLQDIVVTPEGRAVIFDPGMDRLPRAQEGGELENVAQLGSALRDLLTQAAPQFLADSGLCSLLNRLTLHRRRSFDAGRATEEMRGWLEVSSLA